jgi:hypothetical protein
MGMECSTHGEEEESQKESDHQEELDVGGRILLK